MDYILSPTLEILDELLAQKRLSGIEDQVRSLQTKLILLQGLMKGEDASEIWSSDQLRRELGEIIDAAHSAEDTVEKYVLTISYSGGGIDFLKRLAFNSEGEARSKIEAIVSSLNDIHKRCITQASASSHQIQRKNENRIRAPLTKHKHIGMDEKVEELVKSLVDKEEKIVVLCGEPGSGKTTLANKVYLHRAVRSHFDQFAWVNIPKYFDEKMEGYLLKECLHSLISSTGEKHMDGPIKKNIQSSILTLMRQKTCLLVFDEIWSPAKMDGTKEYPLIDLGIFEGLFYSLDQTSSKILVTSSCSNSFVTDSLQELSFIVHEPRYLNKGDIQQLLQTITDDCSDSDSFLETLGRKLAYCSINRPLTITVIGAILAAKPENIQAYTQMLLGYEGEDDLFWHCLYVSYMALPSWLKPCLLYMCQFPVGHEINVSKLVQLWIAEGFVSCQGKKEGKTVEDVAESNLNELISRSLVLVGERDLSLKVKTCYLHETVRHFCLLKATEESFDLNIILLEKDGFHFPCSRLNRFAIQLIEVVYAFPFDIADNVRSLLFFHISKYGSWRLHVPVIEKLGLVRVLDLQGADFGEVDLPKSIGELVHLRYLSLRHAKVSTIPSTLGNLRFLRTLDLLTEEKSVYVPDVIWKLNQLRHLYLPEVCHATTKLRLDTLTNLQTLVNFPARNCDLKDIFVMTNLRELSITDAASIKNFARFSKSLGIKLRHLRRVSLNDSNKDSTKGAEDVDSDLTEDPLDTSTV